MPFTNLDSNNFALLASLKSENLPEAILKVVSLCCFTQEAQVERTDMKGVRTSHEEFGDDVAEHKEIFDTREQQKAEPVRRLEPKIGRNDLCPCGSGKKFKACHGK